jgi:hypothetical protein
MKTYVAKAHNALVQAGKTILEKVENQRGDSSIGIILGVVFVIIVFAFIVVPSGRSFVDGLFTDLTSWYNNLDLFPSS